MTLRIAQTMIRLGLVAGIVTRFMLGSTSAIAAPQDYPTEALADYVFACMATNGQTQESLRRCSCSIDTIAAKLPYDDYVKAETVLRMQQLPGGDGRASMFRGTPWAKDMVDKLREAQVEAESKCF